MDIKKIAALPELSLKSGLKIYAPHPGEKAREALQTPAKVEDKLSLSSASKTALTAGSEPGAHALNLCRMAKIRHSFTAGSLNLTRKSFLPYREVSQLETERTNRLAKLLLGKNKVVRKAGKELISYKEAGERLEAGKTVHFRACTPWLGGLVPLEDEEWHAVSSPEGLNSLSRFQGFTRPAAVIEPPRREGKAILAHWEKASRNPRDGQRIQQPLVKEGNKFKTVGFKEAALRLDQGEAVYFQPMLQDDLLEASIFHRSPRREGDSGFSAPGIAMAPAKIRNYRELQDYYRMEESRLTGVGCF